MRESDFNEQLPERVLDYLSRMSVTLNRSPQTIEQYAGDIRLFLQFVVSYREDKKNLPSPAELRKISVSDISDDFLKAVTVDDGYSFLTYCSAVLKNNSVTRSRKGVAVRRFFKYLFDQGLIPSDPMHGLELPQKPKKLPKYLTLDEARTLLNCVDGKNKERDYCILTLFLNCGMRLSELVSLNYNDIKSDNTVTITGKGNKERVIYLNSACVKAITEYMKVRPVDGLKGDARNALFISGQKRRLSKRMVEEIVSGFLKKSGLDREGISVHKLRHTAATLMYRYGRVDVLLLKEILGHENLSTTQIYTHVSNDQLRTATSANPLNSESSGEEAAEDNPEK